MSGFLREMGLPGDGIRRSDDATVRELAELAGAAAEDLVAFSPRRGVDKRYVELAGESLYRLSVMRTFFRYCPSCVLADIETFDGPRAGRPWLRTEWLLLSLRSCGRHGKLLADGRSVQQHHHAPDFCGTMAEIHRELSGIEAMQEHAAPSPFQDWAISRLSGTRNAGNWLDSMPLRVGMTFCEALGISAMHPPKTKTRGFTELQWAAAADEGFRVASSGEGSIVELLALLNSAQANTKGVWGLRDTFGYLYNTLLRTVDEPDWEKPRDLVANFAIGAIPLEVGANVLGHVIDRQRVHTVRSVSKISGAHPLTVRKLLERQEDWTDRIRSGVPDHRVTLAPDEFAETIYSLTGAISISGVAAMTGFPIGYLRTATAAGLIETVTGQTKLGKGRHQFTTEAVNRMMERMFEGAVEVPRATGSQVSLAKARRSAVASQERILQLVLGDKPPWKGRLPGPMSFHRLLVDADEITARVRSEPAGTGIGKFKMLEFVPGLAREAIGPLIENGYLTLIEQFNPDARRVVQVVSSESAEAFRSRYVTLGELSQRSGLHWKRVMLLLRGAGVQEALNSETFGCFIYFRSDVEVAQGRNNELWDYDKASALRAARLRRS
ncbi:hypothetical protein GGR04_002194 [Aureimonas pseudogalii]|uniref:TniQ domain-containing protein n=2 Tax=Aureimonas pseudogalii TaxID=1744844 RepID=A0A7W6EGJ1_9HYPH|nr:hypothetical protein [Aureimonas pseudogalii]